MTFDDARAEKLLKENRRGEVPNVGQHPMEAAHIIPFMLNNFDDTAINSPAIVLEYVMSFRSHVSRIFVDR